MIYRLTPPSSPPRGNQSNEATHSEKFWRSCFIERLQKIKMEGFDHNGSRNVSNNEMHSKRLNTTSHEGSQKEVVYAAETPENMNLQSASFVENHVAPLSTFLTHSAESPVRSLGVDCLEETVIDEEVVISQSLSMSNPTFSPGVFDEDERELFDLLTELGTKSSDKAETDVNPILRHRFDRRRLQDEKDTHEMTQIISEDNFQREKINEVSCDHVTDPVDEAPKAEESLTSDDEHILENGSVKHNTREEKACCYSRRDILWGDETFWEDFDVDEYI